MTSLKNGAPFLDRRRAAVLVGGDSAMAFWGEQALGLVIRLAYYIPQEAAFGFTVGKLITGTRMVDEDGEKSNLIQVILRTLSRFIPFEPFSVLFIEAPRGWHDSLSGTYVVRKA